MTRPLDECLAAAAVATSGPWTAEGSAVTCKDGAYICVDSIRRDAAFIACAHDLAHHARELQSKVAVVERELGTRMYELLKMGQERDELRTKLGMQTAESDAMYECIQELRAEVARLKGIEPELPPRPTPLSDPDNQHKELPRYAIRWNGPTKPMATPMSHGYWTPFHMAYAEVARLTLREDQRVVSVDLLASLDTGANKRVSRAIDTIINRSPT